MMRVGRRGRVLGSSGSDEEVLDEVTQKHLLQDAGIEPEAQENLSVEEKKGILKAIMESNPLLLVEYTRNKPEMGDGKLSAGDTGASSPVEEQAEPVARKTTIPCSLSRGLESPVYLHVDNVSEVQRSTISHSDTQAANTQIPTDHMKELTVIDTIPKSHSVTSTSETAEVKEPISRLCDLHVLQEENMSLNLMQDKKHMKCRILNQVSFHSKPQHLMSKKWPDLFFSLDNVKPSSYTKLIKLSFDIYHRQLHRAHMQMDGPVRPWGKPVTAGAHVDGCLIARSWRPCGLAQNREKEERRKLRSQQVQNDALSRVEELKEDFCEFDVASATACRPKQNSKYLRQDDDDDDDDDVNHFKSCKQNIIFHTSENISSDATDLKTDVKRKRSGVKMKAVEQTTGNITDEDTLDKKDDSNDDGESDEWLPLKKKKNSRILKKIHRNKVDEKKQLISLTKNKENKKDDQGKKSKFKMSVTCEPGRCSNEHHSLTRECGTDQEHMSICSEKLREDSCDSVVHPYTRSVGDSSWINVTRGSLESQQTKLLYMKDDDIDNGNSEAESVDISQPMPSEFSHTYEGFVDVNKNSPCNKITSDNPKSLVTFTEITSSQSSESLLDAHGNLYSTQITLTAKHRPDSAAVLRSCQEDPRAISRENENQVEDPRAISRENENQVEDPRAISRENENQVEDPRAISRKNENQVEDPRAISRENENQVEDPRDISRENENQVEDPRAISRKNENQVEDPQAISGENENQVEYPSGSEIKIFKTRGKFVQEVTDYPVASELENTRDTVHDSDDNDVNVVYDRTDVEHNNVSVSEGGTDADAARSQHHKKKCDVGIVKRKVNMPTSCDPISSDIFTCQNPEKKRKVEHLQSLVKMSRSMDIPISEEAEGKIQAQACTVKDSEPKVDSEIARSGTKSNRDHYSPPLVKQDVHAGCLPDNACPICRRFFHHSQLEAHASSCGEDSTNPRNLDKSETGRSVCTTVSSCVYCQQELPQEQIRAHQMTCWQKEAPTKRLTRSRRE